MKHNIFLHQIQKYLHFGWHFSVFSAVVYITFIHTLAVVTFKNTKNFGKEKRKYFFIIYFDNDQNKTQK